MSRLFELLGTFVAKCIQDGRRVDLPLSRPFFKLMCSPRGEAGHALGAGGREDDKGAQEGDGSGEVVTAADSVTHEPSNQIRRPHSPSSGSSSSPRSQCVSYDAQISAQEGAGLKEAELLMATAGDKEEISKDGNGKEDVVLEELPADGDAQAESPWFTGILDKEDLLEVNPFRARFLEQVRTMFSDEAMVQRTKVYWC